MGTTMKISLVLAALLSSVQIGAPQNDAVRISAAVFQVLMPFMDEMRAGLENVKSDLASLDVKVCELTKKVANLTESVEVGLPIMKSDLSNITEMVTIVSESLEEHKTQTACELGDLLYEGYPIHTCGCTGGWRRVAYLDMTDPNTTCPSGWQLTEHSKRTCGKNSTGSLTCDSVIFPVSGGAYNNVCGRVRAYQDGATDAFEAYHDGNAATIDDAYVSGVSLTHSSPRQHIWSFAAGISENTPTLNDACPCDATIKTSFPPFVDEDYFCESGANTGCFNTFQTSDPLWDGEGCTSSSTCCSFNNPPYFTKLLPNPTTDAIEVRLCRYDSGDDTPIELMELYVK